MNYKCENAYYFNTLISIGGIESHLYYISRKYGKYDVCIFFQKADKEQLRRLRKYVRAIKITMKDTIECNNLFVCFNREVLDIANAKNRYLVLHGDYKSMVELGQLSKDLLPIDERIDEYIGVSQTICDSWKALTGIDARCVYQPIVLDKSDKALLFISATRLSKEKGFGRMKILAKAMIDAGIKFQWLVFTNQPKEEVEGIIYCKPRLDISNYMTMADAYIQLSDNEGYCLSVVEALMQGIPCITTKLPVLKELGLNDTNSIMLDFDLKEIPINAIKDIWKLKGFKYEQVKDKWDEVLSHKPSTYKAKDKYKVRYSDWWVKNKVYDMELNRQPIENEVVEISQERYEYLKEVEQDRHIKLIYDEE